MTDPSHILTPIDIKKLSSILQELFCVDEVKSLHFVHGGYMGQNFRIDTSSGVFFLKQYRNRLNTIIHEIKAAETYFSDCGLPVVLPIKDRYGCEAFWMKGNWYSLFPFVEARSPVFGDITILLAESLASMLARIHQAGSKFPYRSFQMVRIGNPRKFHMEKNELERHLQQKPQLTPLDKRMLEVLNFKEALVARNNVKPQDFSLDYSCLLHGDYQYFNVFVDDHDQITHIFDFERASIGPTAYECVRSLIINCFDDGWEPRNYDLARRYITTYREAYPLTMDELLQAVRLYRYNIIHMTWIETRYIVFGIETQLPLFERHMTRITKITTEDLDAFCEKIWK